MIIPNQINPANKTGAISPPRDRGYGQTALNRTASCGKKSSSSALARLFSNSSNIVPSPDQSLPKRNNNDAIALAALQIVDGMTISRTSSEKRPKRKKLVDRLRANAKDFTYACTYLGDVVEKNALQLLAGSVTVLLESVLAVTALTTNCALGAVDADPEDLLGIALVSKQSRLFQSLAMLLKWADEQELHFRSSATANAPAPALNGAQPASPYSTHFVMDKNRPKELLADLREAFANFVKSATDYYLAVPSVPHPKKPSDVVLPPKDEYRLQSRMIPPETHIPPLPQQQSTFSKVDIPIESSSNFSSTSVSTSFQSDRPRTIQARQSPTSIMEPALMRHFTFDEAGARALPSQSPVVLKCRLRHASPTRDMPLPPWVRRVAAEACGGDNEDGEACRVVDRSERLDMVTMTTAPATSSHSTRGGDNIRTEAKLTRSTVVEIKVPFGTDVREVVRRMSERLESENTTASSKVDPGTIDLGGGGIKGDSNTELATHHNSGPVGKSSYHHYDGEADDLRNRSGGAGGELDELLEDLKLKLTSTTTSNTSGAKMSNGANDTSRSNGSHSVPRRLIDIHHTQHEDRNGEAAANYCSTLKSPRKKSSVSSIHEVVRNLPYPDHLLRSLLTEVVDDADDDEGGHCGHVNHLTAQVAGEKMVATNVVASSTTSHMRMGIVAKEKLPTAPTLDGNKFRYEGDSAKRKVCVEEERSHDRHSTFLGQDKRYGSDIGRIVGPSCPSVAPLNQKETQITTYMRTIGEYSIPCADDFFRQTTEVFFRDIQRHWDSRQSQTPSPKFTFQNVPTSIQLRQPPLQNGSKVMARITGDPPSQDQPRSSSANRPSVTKREDLSTIIPRVLSPHELEDDASSGRYSSPYYESSLYDTISKGTSINSFSSSDRIISTPCSSLSSLSPPAHKYRERETKSIPLPVIQSKVGFSKDIKARIAVTTGESYYQINNYGNDVCLAPTNKHLRGNEVGENGTRKGMLAVDHMTASPTTRLIDLEPSAGDLIFKDDLPDVSTVPADPSLSPHTRSQVMPLVKCGSITAFLVYATCPTKNDFLFQEALIMTYSTFITTRDLVDRLLKRYSHFSYSDDILNTRASRCCFSFLIRVLDDMGANEMRDDIVQTLMDNVYGLVLHGELVLAKILRKKIMDKLHTVDTTGQPRTPLHSLTNSKTDIDSSLTHSTPDQIGAASPTIHHSLSASNLLKRPTHNTLIDFRTMDLAEQMTLQDSQLFYRLPLTEILTWARVQNDSLAPNLTAFTEHFNNVSYWCRTLVLQQNDLKLRERYFCKFIKVLDKLRALGNFNSYLAILSALDCGPVRRVFFSSSDWSLSSANPSQRKLVRMNEILKSRHCSLIDSSGSFRNYRKAISESEPPCIPYIGLVLQDLTFINVGNPDETPQGLINFTKRWQYFSVLESIVRFRKCHYQIKKDEKITKFFNGFKDHLPEEVLWRISESIKPRH